MGLNPEEVSAILRKEIDRFESKLEMASVGVVLQVGDGIARVWGLHDVMMSELVTFPGDVTGFVLNLETDNVGVAILGNYQGIKEGDLVRRTGKVSQVPVGKGLWGRVINPLGEPLDGEEPIVATSFRLLESGAPNVVERQPVKEPLQTGLRAVDSMIPIGRGQRELIIGDRQTGKTAIAIDAIINQKGANVHCIYVAIGQKASSVARVVEVLKQHGAMEYTTVVSATANDPAPMQYIAPYAGCAIGEDSMYNGGHALVIYDDLSKHAQAYRQLSLLLRRPPGREAYPGDIFYCHSRLLERAAKLNERRGGGSLTALPIIETQAGDVSAYIPTNVISITDGQIYLEPDLFFAGTRPAINVGISVSRVGGKAQTKAMKSVAAILRLELAQYRELEAFARFGAELDASTRAQLARGERMVEILKQGQYVPESLSRQVIAIWAGVNGQFDKIPVVRLRLIEPLFFDYLRAAFSKVERAIETDKQISEATAADLKTAATAIWGFHLTIQWLAGEKRYVAMVPTLSVRRFETDFSRHLISRIAQDKIPDILRTIGASDKIDEKSERILDEEAKLFLPLFLSAEIVREREKELIAAKIPVAEFTAAFAEHVRTVGRDILNTVMTQKKYSDEAKLKLQELCIAFRTGYGA